MGCLMVRLRGRLGDARCNETEHRKTLVFVIIGQLRCGSKIKKCTIDTVKLKKIEFFAPVACGEILAGKSMPSSNDSFHTH